MFHFSDAKPALMNKLSLLLLLISGKLNSKLFNNFILTILIFNNAVPSQYIQTIDSSLLFKIRNKIQIDYVVNV